MCPNPALRHSLPEFMRAFFKDSMTVLDKPKEQLASWYEKHIGEKDEFIPLFLDEDHADLCLGHKKDSFMLKNFTSLHQF